MRIVFLFTFVFALDQVTKQIVRSRMELGKSIQVLGDFFRLTYVENPGIAFGIRVGNHFIFTILSIFACIMIVAYLISQWKESLRMKMSLVTILGGAVGNLIDRILHQRVVDFIDVGIRDMRWPVFNIADSAVVVGMALLVIHVVLEEREKHSSVSIESRDIA